eukprot:TRINITY_DN25065_c0_g1_i1.p1 TRINITY_DN25065_c0_g1~~TRINITY_DN25065_c0_g1_i1.p1  ORF type:complete len:1252 (+),score=285.60 TRINITY_DN25065_c0_g1_i1:213-3968(+)
MRRRRVALPAAEEEALQSTFSSIGGGNAFTSDHFAGACVEHPEVAHFFGLGDDPEAEDVARLFAALDANADGSKSISWDALKLWYAKVILERKAAAMDATLPPDPPWIAAGGQRAPQRGVVRLSNDDLQEATLRGDVGLVRRLIEAGASVNVPLKPYGEDVYMNLLHILASKSEMPNCTAIIAELLHRRADVDAQTSKGTTPLIMACSARFVEAAEVLLEHGANPDVCDDFGKSALHAAILDTEEGEDTAAREAVALELIELLNAWGADLGIKADHDHTGLPRGKAPIVQAVTQQSEMLVNALLNMGAEADGLHEAVISKNHAIVQALVENDANPFLEDANGKNVMEVAIEVGNQWAPEMLRDLMGKLEREQHPHMKTLLHRKPAADPNLNTCKSNKTMRLTTTTNEQRKIWAFARKVNAFSLKITRNFYYGSAQFIVLCIALFLPDMWVIMQVQAMTLFTVFLSFVLLFFFCELTLNILSGGRKYLESFWFWTDMIGMLSVPMDHELFVSFIENSVASSGIDSTMLMRAMRMVRLVSRAGRLTKLIKLIKYLPGMSQDDGGSTKTSDISKKLTMVLSMRAGAIIIFMCVLLPIIDSFGYPAQDRSMLSWSNIINQCAYTNPEGLPATIARMKSSYSHSTTYFPYEVSIALQNGTNLSFTLEDNPPLMDKYIETFVFGSTTLRFDFGTTMRIMSAANLLLILTIATLTLVASLIVTKAVTGIVKPLDNIVATVHKGAKKTFRTVRLMAKRKSSNTAGEMDEDELAHSEIDFLDKLLETLQVFMEVTLKKKHQEQADSMHISDGDRTMLAEYSSGAIVDSTHNEENVDLQNYDLEEDEELDKFIDCNLAEASASFERLGDWELSCTTLTPRQQHEIMVAILMQTAKLHSTAEQDKSPRRLKDAGLDNMGLHTLYADFVNEVCARHYSEVEAPFHNWVHAVETTCTLFQVFDICKCNYFLTALERHALVVAALAHDIAHPGVNNLFLIETSNELAVRYNDSAPLENMHASTLFSITNQDKFSIFKRLDKESLQTVRRVIIDSILDTDQARHFSLISDFNMIYEHDTNCFDDAFEEFIEEGAEQWPPQNVVEIIRLPEHRKVLASQVLHLCDTAHPAKNWTICRYWSDRAMEECHKQGDVEEELGLPVAPLNQRGTNQAYTMISNIDMVIAPMLWTTVHLFPPLAMTEENMLDNMQRYFVEWISECVSPDEEERDRMQERISNLRQETRHYAPAHDSAAPRGNSTHQLEKLSAA